MVCLLVFNGTKLTDTQRTCFYTYSNYSKIFMCIISCDLYPHFMDEKTNQ